MTTPGGADVSSRASSLVEHPVLDRWGRAAWSVLGIGLAVAGGFWLTMRLVAIVIPLVVALLVATQLWPIVRRLEGRGVPSSASVWIVLVGLLGVTATLGAWLVATISGEAGAVRSSAASGVTKIENWLVSGPIGLDRARVDSWDSSVRAQLPAVQNRIALGALSQASLAIEVVGGAVLTVVLVFYLLRLASDDRAPGGAAPFGSTAVDGVWWALSGFGRGVIVNATVNSLVLGVTLWILRVPLAGPIAAITFVASFVPIVGAIVSGGLAALVALVEVGPVVGAIVVVVTIAIHHLEGYVVGPLVIGRRTGVHPVALIVSVAIGLALAGVAGAFLAGPVLAAGRGVALGRGESPPD